MSHQSLLIPHNCSPTAPALRPDVGNMGQSVQLLTHWLLHSDQMWALQASQHSCSPTGSCTQTRCGQHRPVNTVAHPLAPALRPDVGTTGQSTQLLTYLPLHSDQMWVTQASQFSCSPTGPCTQTRCRQHGPVNSDQMFPLRHEWLFMCTILQTLQH